MRCFACLALCLLVVPCHAAEQDAVAIDANIQARHTPYGMILAPVLSPETGEVVSYTRCGDSGIWTGHYLAAESFRYKVTKSAEALANITKALAGIQLLVDVTGAELLARCAVPADSPYAGDLTNEESRHGIYEGRLNDQPWLWVGNTSRDQYSGVFFGLAVAYDMVDDKDVRASAAALVTRMLAFLQANSWNIVMPNGDISTTFLVRPDQQLTLLQIGRHVNAARFGSQYDRDSGALASSTAVPIGIDCANDHASYFKFNLDYINLYNLIRLQGGGFTKFWYNRAYDILRGTTEGHGNAHFNMIDRALNDPDRKRDAETRALLDAWLLRPRTDEWVDWRGTVAACDSPDRACKPLPVEDRVRTDFLWQRSPFLLYGGGEGKIETAGIDYLLPYWMGRFYGVTQ